MTGLTGTSMPLTNRTARSPRAALLATGLSLLTGWLIGPWVFAATVFGLAAAWAYSAPPFRFKTSGWIGPAVVGLTYEGLSWFTGASVMAGALPALPILLVLGLYSLGAHGIMTLNDFKAVEGDRATGLRSLPVTLGVERAASSLDIRKAYRRLARPGFENKL